MKTILYNPIFINPQAYYVFPRLTRWLRPDDSYKEPANYIGQIEVTIIAYGEIGYTEYFEHTNYIDFTNFSNSYVRISLFTRLGSCVLGEWKIGTMEGDRPYIEPEVLASLRAVVIVGDKTNQDKDRDIVANLVDASNPFIISNAAYKLNSGYGKYEEDFTSWDRIDASTAEISNDGSKIKCINTILNVQYLFNSINKDIPSFKVKISNFTKGNIAYYYRKEDGTEAFLRIEPSPLDKVLELPKSYNTVEGGTGSRGGFYSSNINIGVTIEQIPSYQGAFVTDGINDLITSTKTVQEMLGGSNEITVVSMIHGIGSKNAYTNVLRESDSNYIRNTSTADGKTGIYGYTSKDTTKSIITDILGDKNDYKLEHIQTSTPSTINSVFSVAGWRDSSFSMVVYPIAWYWTFIANKVLTTDQINQVIAYYNLDRCVEPTVLYDVKRQGLSNDTPDSDWYLKDFSKNGFDMSLFNFAKKGNSGVGKYETDFLDSSIWKYKTNSSVTSDKIVCNKAATHIMLLYYSITDGNKYDVPSFNVLKQGDASEYYYIDEQGIRRTFKLLDGINTLPASHGTLFTGTEATCGFGNPGIGNSVTITQIPSHAGALCLDGVNDFGKVTGMPIYKDYTFIIEREFLNETFPNQVCLVSKSKVGSEIENGGAFIVDNISVNSIINPYSFYKTTSLPGLNTFDRQIVFQSKYKYLDKDIAAGTATDSDTLWLGTFRDNDSRFANVAIYSLMSFPYSMSEFLIERQLKKHKLGTLYPDMVEFRPVIKTNTEWEYLEIYQGDNRLYNLSEHDDKTGIYLEENSSIGIYVKPYTGQKVSKIVYNGTSYIDLENNDYGYYYITVPVTKSPQKIGITIEWDENYVQWNPVVESNVAYKSIRYYKLGDSGSGWIGINIGDYIPIGRMIMITIDTANTVDELVSAVSSQLTGIDINGSNGTYNITGTLTSESPQNINITIDEYIRYEDIVQPYPVLLRFNDENGNEVSWGR